MALSFLDTLYTTDAKIEAPSGQIWKLTTKRYIHFVILPTPSAQGWNKIMLCCFVLVRMYGQNQNILFQYSSCARGQASTCNSASGNSKKILLHTNSIGIGPQNFLIRIYDFNIWVVSQIFFEGSFRWSFLHIFMQLRFQSFHNHNINVS